MLWAWCCQHCVVLVSGRYRGGSCMWYVTGGRLPTVWYVMGGSIVFRCCNVTVGAFVLLNIPLSILVSLR